MLLGASSFLNLEKPSNDNKEDEFNFDNKSHLLIVNNSVEPVNNGKTYEFIYLPSPNNPLVPEKYIVNNNRLFILKGIKPNINKVSLFINDILTTPDCLLATFEFDIIFIFISILYFNKDKYLTMPSRIMEFYNNKTEYNLKTLQSGVMILYNNNINNIKKRLEYLCDVIESPGSNELLLKPNNNKFTQLLKFKVNNMVQYAIENNILISDYCDSTVTSSNEYVRKTMIIINEDRLRLFCWAIVKSYLSNVVSTLLIPTDINTLLSKPIKIERKSQPLVTTTTTTNNKKPKTKSNIKGTPSISSFFKPKS